jgi:hypothetical protein
MPVGMAFTETIDCDLKCPVPAGVTMTEVPGPRHAWSDVFVCPNEGCGRCFLLLRKDCDESVAEAPGMPQE